MFLNFRQMFLNFSQLFGNFKQMFMNFSQLFLNFSQLFRNICEKGRNNSEKGLNSGIGIKILDLDSQNNSRFISYYKPFYSKISLFASFIPFLISIYGHFHIINIDRIIANVPDITLNLVIFLNFFGDNAAIIYRSPFIFPVDKIF